MNRYIIKFEDGNIVTRFADDISELLAMLDEEFPGRIHTSIELVK